MEVVQLLLEKGADFGAKDNIGRTALHVACISVDESTCSSRVDIARMLLAKGADVGATTNAGNTPLHNACSGKEKQSELVALLLENGAKWKRKSIDGDTPLHRACYFAHSKIVKMLLEARGTDGSQIQ